MGNSIAASIRLLRLFVSCALLTAFAHAQTTGEAVQQQLNAAIAAGQSTYTLPAGNIVLNSALVIPPGTRNFTIVGQSGTRLVRSSSSDFSLLSIGIPGWHAFQNSAFANNPSTAIASAVEGDQILTTTSGATVVPGWYALIGTDPVNDIVRHFSSGETYWFRRELVQVLAVNGNQVRLAQPVGRDFATAELRQIEPTNATANQRVIVDNVTVRNVTFDGRSPLDGSYANKVVVAGLTHNITFDDISVMGFRTCGLSALMSKGVLVNRSRVTDGNLNSMGYGIELGATRFSTIRSCTFLRTRTGVLLQSGNMDVLVEDCTGTTSQFDVGHGTGELRLTYRRTVGASFGIANSSWRRGVDRVLLEDCTGLNSIHIYGGASNVVIRGKHASYSQTTPVFFLYTEAGGNAIPSAPTFVQSLTLENGFSNRSDADGVNMQFSSISNVPRMLGNLTIRNWSFTNNVTNLGANLNLQGISVTPNIVIENSRLTNSAQWSAPIWLGPNTNNSQWNLTLRNCRLQSAGNCGVLLESGSTANVVNESTTFNGSPFTTANIRGAEGLRGPIQ